MFTFLLKLATVFLLALVAVPSLAEESEHLGTDELVRDGLGALSSGNKSGAQRLFERACSMKDGEGCRHLAIGYLVGDGGVSRDFAVSMRFFSRACIYGDAEACAFLGSSYLNGYGSVRNARLGEEYNRRAELLFQEDRIRFARECLTGELKKCDDLGMLYERGKGGNADRSMAARFYGKACDAGYGHGCFSLSQLQESGEKTGKSQEQAAVLMGRGCELGDLSSCVLLAIDFKMAQQYEKASLYYGKACALDHLPACREQKRLEERRMSP